MSSIVVVVVVAAADIAIIGSNTNNCQRVRELRQFLTMRQWIIVNYLVQWCSFFVVVVVVSSTSTPMYRHEWDDDDDDEPLSLYLPLTVAVATASCCNWWIVVMAEYPDPNTAVVLFK